MGYSCSTTVFKRAEQLSKPFTKNARESAVSPAWPDGKALCKPMPGIQDLPRSVRYSWIYRTSSINDRQVINTIENDKIHPAIPLALHIEQLFGQWIEDNFER
jgi:hypothetical protein